MHIAFLTAIKNVKLFSVFTSNGESILHIFLSQKATISSFNCSSFIMTMKYLFKLSCMSLKLKSLGLVPGLLLKMIRKNIFVLPWPSPVSTRGVRNYKKYISPELGLPFLLFSFDALLYHFRIFNQKIQLTIS